jgi:hypothetical protein
MISIIIINDLIMPVKSTREHAAGGIDLQGCGFINTTSSRRYDFAVTNFHSEGR